MVKSVGNIPPSINSHQHPINSPSHPTVDETFTQAMEWIEEEVMVAPPRKEEKKKSNLDIALSILKLSQKLTKDKNVKKILKVPESLGKLAKIIQSYGSEKSEEAKDSDKEKTKSKSVKEKDWRAYVKEGMEYKKPIMAVSKVFQAGSKLLELDQVISITEKLSNINFHMDMANIILQPTFSLNPSQLFGTEKERSALLKNIIAITAFTVSAAKSTSPSESLSQDTLKSIVDNTSELLRFECGVVSIFGLNPLVEAFNTVRYEGVQSLTLVNLLDCTNAAIDVVMFVVDTKKQITFVAIGVIALGIGTYHIWNAYQQSKAAAAKIEEIPLVNKNWHVMELEEEQAESAVE